jgi:hypothetical protein
MIARVNDLRTFSLLDEAAERRLRTAKVDREALERLAEVGAPNVRAALELAQAADKLVRDRYLAWHAAASKNRYDNAQAAAGFPVKYSPSDVAGEAFFAIKPALEAADAADVLLAQLLRAAIAT